jgi:hypothetical protein
MESTINVCKVQLAYLSRLSMNVDQEDLAHSLLRIDVDLVMNVFGLMLFLTAMMLKNIG